MLESLVRDLGAAAARQLRRSPGFAAAAILTLAAGIAANTATLSVNALVLRELLRAREASRCKAVGVDVAARTTDLAALRQRMRSLNTAN
jgi:hypothetical protein